VIYVPETSLIGQHELHHCKPQSYSNIEMLRIKRYVDSRKFERRNVLTPQHYQRLAGNRQTSDRTGTLKSGTV